MNSNWLRWLVLIVALLLVVVVVSYPPWIYVHPNEPDLVEQMGYAPLNRPPVVKEGVRVNRVWVGIELGAVTGAAIVLLILVWPEKGHGRSTMQR